MNPNQERDLKRLNFNRFKYLIDKRRYSFDTLAKLLAIPLDEVANLVLGRLDLISLDQVEDYLELVEEDSSFLESIPQ